MSVRGLIKNTMFKKGELPLSTLNISNYHPNINNEKSLLNVGITKELLLNESTYTTFKPIEFNIGGIKKGTIFINTPISEILDVMFIGGNFNPVLKINFTVVNNSDEELAFTLIKVKGIDSGVGFINVDYGDGNVRVLKYNKELDYQHNYIYKRGIYKVRLSFDSLVDSIEFQDDSQQLCYVKDVEYPDLYTIKSIPENKKEKNNRCIDNLSEEEINILGKKSITLDKFNIHEYTTNLNDEKSLLNIESCNFLVNNYLTYKPKRKFNFSVGNVVDDFHSELTIKEVLERILFSDSHYDVEIIIKVVNNTDSLQRVCLFNILTFNEEVIGRVEYDKLEGDTVQFYPQPSGDNLNKILQYEKLLGNYNPDRIFDLLPYYQSFYKEIPIGEHTVRILLSKGVRNIIFFDGKENTNNYITGISKFKADKLKYLDSTFINIPRLELAASFKINGRSLEVINNLFNGIGGAGNLITISKDLLVGAQKLKKAIGIFSNSYIESIPKGFLDNNIDLECVDYLFYKCIIGKYPLGEIHVNTYLDLVNTEDEDILIPRSLFWRNSKIKSLFKAFYGIEHRLGTVKGIGDIPFLLRKKFLEIGTSLSLSPNVLWDYIADSSTILLDKDLYNSINDKNNYKLVTDVFKRV